MAANSAVSAKASRARSRKRPADRRPPTRYGHEVPRIYTKPLRKLTPQTSLGYSVIAFADNVLGVNLLPWQRWLLIHMLELRPDNMLRFRTVVVLVARQNGKSTLSQVLALWAIYVYGFSLVLGTAQDLDTAEEVWQGAVDLVQELDEDDQPVRPDLAAQLAKVVLVNGKKSLNLTTGERYKVKAANRRAGRGLSGDLILLDELREHQSWDAWGAITKTTMARALALILALSNAGDATSIVLRYLRKLAHAALGDPDGINAEETPGGDLAEEPEDEDLEADEDTLGLFEWSAPPGCAVTDRNGWAAANPSMNHTITERTIASACKTDPEWVFRTEVLCQWPSGALDGPFPTGAWSDCTDPNSAIADGSPIGLCVDVSWDRSAAHVAVAGRREDGMPHVEVIASRAGTDWVIPWLTSPERDERIRSGWAGGPDGPRRDTTGPPVAVQKSGAPASSLIPGMLDAGVDVTEWGGGDLAAATGQIYDHVREGTLRHRPQPILDVAAATAAAKPLGDAWVWDRKKSPADVAPLIAVTGAAWLVEPKAPEKAAPDPRVHEWPEDLIDDYPDQDEEVWI